MERHSHCEFGEILPGLFLPSAGFQLVAGPRFISMSCQSQETLYILPSLWIFATSLEGYKSFNWCLSWPYYDLLISYNKSTLRGSKWAPWTASKALDRLVSYKFLFRENLILFKGLGLAWGIKVLRTHILPLCFLDLQDSEVGSNFYILAQGEPDSQIPSFLSTPVKVL